MTTKTTKVRIMLAVTPAGAWFAYGWNDAKDEDCQSVIYDMAADESHLVWKTIVAEVELPQTQEVTGHVE